MDSSLASRMRAAAQEVLSGSVTQLSRSFFAALDMPLPTESQARRMTNLTNPQLLAIAARRIEIQVEALHALQREGQGIEEEEDTDDDLPVQEVARRRGRPLGYGCRNRRTRLAVEVDPFTEEDTGLIEEDEQYVDSDGTCWASRQEWLDDKKHRARIAELQGKCKKTGRSFHWLKDKDGRMNRVYDKPEPERSKPKRRLIVGRQRTLVPDD